MERRRAWDLGDHIRTSGFRWSDSGRLSHLLYLKPTKAKCEKPNLKMVGLMDTFFSIWQLIANFNLE